MRWFRSNIEGAGLNRFSTTQVLVALAVSTATIGVSVQTVFKVYALTLFCVLGFVALALEFLSSAAARRRRELKVLWPEVVDALQSAVAAGLSMTESFEDLARRGPFRLRKYFEKLVIDLDRGIEFAVAIDNLKRALGEAHADKTCEVLRLVANTGAENLARVLRAQASSIRAELNVVGQLESKQGWVVGTAKIAVVAPWIIVALLSVRPENAAIYNSVSGASILLIGFVVSIFAYRLVHIIGALPAAPRVFSL